MTHVLRFETNSTCGRPGMVICCRTWDGIYESNTATLVRPAGNCGSDGFSDTCESPLARVAEGCADGGCPRPAQELVKPERCGNGRRDPGEECDPPDDKTCTTWCRRCPEMHEAISIGCSDQDTIGATAAVPGEFLVTFSGATRNGSRVLATRLNPSGKVIDEAVPVAADDSARRPTIDTVADSATADDAGFYVAWVDEQGRSGFWRGRRVPVSGAISSGIDQIDGYGSGGLGTCQSFTRGPLGLALSLDGTRIYHTVEFGDSCFGLDSLGGVPFQFQTSPEERPLVLSTGPGRLARGAHDVAALLVDGRSRHRGTAREYHPVWRMGRAGSRSLSATPDT